MAEEKEPQENQSANPFHIWFQAQRAWADSWKNMTEMANPLLGQGFTLPDLNKIYDGWMKTYGSAMDQMGKAPVADNLRQTYETFLGSANAFMGLHKTWSQMAESWRKAGAGSLSTDALKAWSENVKGMVQSLLGLPLMGPLRSILGTEGDLPSTLMRMMSEGASHMSDSAIQAVLPWFGAIENFTKTTGAIQEGQAGPGTYRKFNETWMQTYRDTMGRFLGMPMVGPTRQTVEKMMKAADSFMKFSGATIDFMFRMYEPGQQAFERLSEKMKDLMQKDPSPETFREFYNLVLKVYEMRFYELFKSESFTTGMHFMLNSALEFRRNNDALMETMLKDTPIVTRTEMDEVLGEIYRLKKSVRRLEAEVEGSKSQAGRNE
jgi:class III poly(R)-hydroxyalkanoic acid synthase PhaE subunit